MLHTIEFTAQRKRHICTKTYAHTIGGRAYMAARCYFLASDFSDTILFPENLIIVFVLSLTPHTYSGVPQLQNTTHLLSCQSGVRCTFATVSLTTHSPPPRHAWHTHYNSPWSPWNSAKCLHRQLILSLQLPTFSPLQSRPVSPRSANQESLADFSGSRYKIQVATETGTREWTICSYRSLINDAPIAVPMNEQVCKWATSVRLQSEMQIPDLCPIDII